MKFKDSVNDQQRYGQIMPRYAPDDEQSDKPIAWEDIARLPVVARRSPWKTVGQDDDSLFATVSDDYVALLSGLSEPLFGSTSTQPITEDLISPFVLSIISKNISAITQEVINTLPVVDFQCP